METITFDETVDFSCCVVCQKGISPEIELLLMVRHSHHPNDIALLVEGSVWLVCGRCHGVCHFRCHCGNADSIADLEAILRNGFVCMICL